MFTNYGPYDQLHIELINQDRQRQLNTLVKSVLFEGVELKAGDAGRTVVNHSSLHTVLAGLRNGFVAALQTPRHLLGRI